MTAGAADGGYLRYPAICGDTVVFCCEDDLWTVPAGGGTAGRLTAGVSEASHPRLSPDGRLVAFVGADDGPTEVYVMELAGGPARRLTHQAAARCAVVGWHPYTGEILYASTAEQPAGFGFRLFAVHPRGGPARLLRHGPASAVSFGPGGAVVLGRNSADPARWKRYRGGAAGELWVDRDGTGRFERLTAPPGNLASPCWAGERIWFVSDHEGTGNVYSCRPDGTGLSRHTDHQDFYVRNLSTDGRRLVYHAGARLHLLDPADGTHRPLQVRLPASRSQHARRFVPAADYLDGARLSPDGAGLALLARGKAFTMAHWSGAVRRHGTPEGVRYRLLTWLSDGRRLVAVAGDERPDERLVLLSADGGAGEAELPVGDVGVITELAASPASGTVAFATNRQQLWTVDTDSALPEARLLDRSEFERIEDLAWSPDGRWLAYTLPDTPWTSAIKVAEVALGRTAQVTRPVLRDARPAFDPGGRYLYFVGQRDLTPDHDQVQFDVGFPFGARPYLVTLRADEPCPFVPRPALPGELPSLRGEDGGDPPAGAPFVDIDLADIDRRVVALPVPEGRYASVVGLHDRVLLLSVPVTAPDPARPAAPPEGTVVAVDLATGEVTEDFLGPVDDLSVNAAADTLLYRWNDRLRVLKADTAQETAEEHDTPFALPGRATGWIDLDRVKVPLRPAAEWRQMFREAWRLQRESFWNADMDGVDWAAMYDRYAPLADLVASRSELSDLLWELQGELATSHAYERGGEYRRAGGQAQGFLGVDWDVTRSGGRPVQWRVARVLHGDPWNREATSPLNRPGVNVRPGDAVVAVNGQPVGPAGPGELLVGLAGQEVELTLLREGAAPRRVTVRATACEARARYRDWVEQNRQYVRAASRGRLGYLHVPDMFHTGYAEFVRGFLAELDLEGLLVDVRFNGGGHVSPLLLDRLARRRTGAEHGRWSGVAPYPLESPRGPMAVLVNEQTGSDGEIFSHMFRVLGLGKLVGSRTWGGVIATWPRHELVDGTVTTQPEFRYYLRGVGDGLENHGVEPDIPVEVAPHRHQPGEDVQLAAAVRHLLDLLGGEEQTASAPQLTRTRAR
jgi:tricorn protease